VSPNIKKVNIETDKAIQLAKKVMANGMVFFNAVMKSTFTIYGINNGEE
jgi:hypothetical protein